MTVPPRWNVTWVRGSGIPAARTMPRNSRSSHEWPPAPSSTRSSRRTPACPEPEARPAVGAGRSRTSSRGGSHYRRPPRAWTPAIDPPLRRSAERPTERRTRRSRCDRRRATDCASGRRPTIRGLASCGAGDRHFDVVRTESVEPQESACREPSRMGVVLRAGELREGRPEPLLPRRGMAWERERPDAEAEQTPAGQVGAQLAGVNPVPSQSARVNTPWWAAAMAATERRRSSMPGILVRRCVTDPERETDGLPEVDAPDPVMAERCVPIRTWRRK